jgi:4-hydroxy-4-methyl-2-oxoglutarate aldolase
VFTRGICIKGTDKHNPGRINVPLMFAGTPVSPGDIILGDCDGIMVVPAAELDRAVALGERRAAKENQMREQITAGARLIDLLGLPDRRPAR